MAFTDTWNIRRKPTAKSTIFGGPSIGGPPVGGPSWPTAIGPDTPYGAPQLSPAPQTTGLGPPPKLDFIPETQTLTDPVTGMPTSTGYYDEAGNWVETRSWDRLSGLMGDLEGYQVPTPVSLTDSDQFAALTALAERIETGLTATDVTTATEQAATMAGLAPGVYQQLAGDVAAGRGLTDVQRAEFERSTLRSTREAERFAQDQLNTMRAGSGSSYRQWAAVEAGIDKINDVRSAGRLAQLNAELERTVQKMAQIEGIAGSAQQQLVMLQQGWGQAAQIYANQVMTIYQENVQDREAITASVQLTMNAIDAELGFGAAMDTAELTAFEQYMAPQRVRWEQWAIEQEAYAADSEEKMNGWLVGLAIGGLIIQGLGIFF